MFKLGDLLEHKKPHIIGTRMVVSIGSIYYTTKMIDTYYDGAIVYIPLEFERNYKCVGNILEKKELVMNRKRLTKRAGWHKDIDLTDELGYSYIYQRLSELENAIEDKLLIKLPCPIDSKVYYIVKTFNKSGDLSSKYYHIIQGKATWANMPRVIREWGKTCFGDLESAQKVKKQLKNT